VAFLGDVALHEVVEPTTWLREHEPMIVGGVLALAGVAQLSPLTRRCLTACRLPGPVLMANYGRGADAEPVSLTGYRPAAGM
jgi:predicted metal-binding membrane protein